MAELIVARRIRRRYFQKIDWRLTDAQNPFELAETEFIRRFRLNKIAATELMKELRPLVSLGNYGYSLEIYVLSTLSMLGSGSFQHVISDAIFSQMSQATISRGTSKVLNALMAILPNYIKFPTAQDELQLTKQNFYVELGFPNIIGAIDCTHINIKKPLCHDWFVYLNRKSNFSVNVQMVCDARMKILDVVARWPGSTHDARIWHLSCLRHAMSSGIIPDNNFLLGDSGYPLEPWLLTPYLDPTSPKEEIFNNKHRKARNIIERCFGVLKSRFRILDKSGGILCYSPEKVCTIIMACAVLHNVCIKYNVDEPELVAEEDDECGDISPDGSSVSQNNARVLRDRIAMHFQSRR